MMVIYDFDRMSKDDRIGQLRVPLSEVDLGDTVQQWRDVQPPEVEEELVREGLHCFREQQLHRAHASAMCAFQCVIVTPQAH